MTSQQNTVAADLLAQFNRPVPVQFISKAQDWQTRQMAQYEAMKGLVKGDFLALEDYKFEMEKLLDAGGLALKPSKVAWDLMKKTKVIDTQPKIMQQLVEDPQMGLVGKFLRSLAGFVQMFLPNEIDSGIGSRL
jgi:hypothetical protein